MFKSFCRRISNISFKPNPVKLNKLPELVRTAEQFPFTFSESILDMYNGNDWKEYIRYSSERPFELCLSKKIPLFLIGLRKNQHYPIHQPSLIKILDELDREYVVERYGESTNIAYKTFCVKEGDIRGKELTSLLVLKNLDLLR